MRASLLIRLLAASSPIRAWSMALGSRRLHSREAKVDIHAVSDLRLMLYGRPTAREMKKTAIVYSLLPANRSANCFAASFESCGKRLTRQNSKPHLTLSSPQKINSHPAKFSANSIPTDSLKRPRRCFLVKVHKNALRPVQIQSGLRKLNGEVARAAKSSAESSK